MIRASIGDSDVELETDSRLFSPREVDAGTLAMLSCVQFSAKDKVLDLGCGYGVVGIVAAKQIGAERVFMIDNDAVAIEIASSNARINGVDGITVVQSDGFRDFAEIGFTQILCNPPYHADFGVPKHFVHKGFNRLDVGGRLWMVTQRTVWYRNKLKAIFGFVREHSNPPYTVFEATKTSASYAKTTRGRA
ncbi:MAG: rRNA (guanine1207-N2)-methyltransferase [Gammaproteobacteria bacterium]|nr:rRNA (guanine1207-N2)-methyltransferase [Gammaproteobacteria bacterium]